METSLKIEILLVANLYNINNKGADQTAGLCLCCSQTPKTGFLASRPNYDIACRESLLYTGILCQSGSFGHNRAS